MTDKRDTKKISVMTSEYKESVTTDEKKFFSRIDKLDEDTVQATLMDLMYVGFSPEGARLDVMKNLTDGQIVAAVAVYVQVGNNGNRTNESKRKNPSTLGRTLESLIKPHSLARVGVAFMPLTYAIRKLGVSKRSVKPRFAKCNTPVELQDPAFSGWQDEKCYDFMILFDKALRNTKGAHGPDEVERWMGVSKVGFLSDGPVRDFMKETVDYSSAVSWLKSLRKMYIENGLLTK
jgi:hypothetical protein